MRRRRITTEPTGVEGLDKMLGGGFPRPCAVLLIGSMGSGKSTLAKQLVSNMLRNDFHVLYYAVEESAEDVKRNLVNFGIDPQQLDKYVHDMRLHIVDMFDLGVKRLEEALSIDEPAKIIENAFNFSEMLSLGRSFAITDIEAKKLAILDSATPLFLTVDPKKVFQFAQVLKFATRMSKGIGLAILHSGILGEPIENALYNFADLVIEMQRRKVEEAVTRGGSMRILKTIRASPPARDYYYELTDKGLIVSAMPTL
jgi:KaiC/GvpD/RAD55 family RecA-like ATPase